MAKTLTSMPGGQHPDNPKSVHRVPITNGSAPNAEPAFDPPAPLPESVAAPVSPIEELDLESYRVNQDFSEHLQAGKRPVVIPVGRPPRQEWILYHRSLNNYTIMDSSILYFHRNTTGAELISS
jgi:hypothetical protein